MRYAAAFVLATLAGNTNPDASAISKILGSVGIECDQDKAKKVVEACKGKSVDQVIEEGMKKLSSLPTAGPAPAAGGAAQAATTDAKKGGAKEEPKKEEKKPAKESDDEGDDMGFGLFD